MGLFNDLYSWATGGDTSDAYTASNQILEQRKKNIKGAQQLAQEGRAVAGQAAADKAGQAKKAAVGAAKMANASKLTAATQGAAAAGEAASQGYQDAANTAAALESQKESQLSDLAKQQSENLIQQKENEAKRKQSQNQTTLGAVASVLSDGNKKRKHCYISPEER